MLDDSIHVALIEEIAKYILTKLYGLNLAIKLKGGFIV